MDASAGRDPGTGGRAGRRGVPFAIPLRPPRRGTQYLAFSTLVEDDLEEDGQVCSVDGPELLEHTDRFHRGPGPLPLASAVTRRLGDAQAGARAVIRQSVLYSDRPKRSRGTRGRGKSHTESQAQKDASEVSSSDLGTSTDMPKFKTLSLNDAPSPPDSTDRKQRAEAGRKTHIRQSVLYSEHKRQSRHERGAQPPTLLKPGCAEAGSNTHVRQSVLYSERKRQSKRGGRQQTLPGEHDSTTVGSSRLEEASPSLSEELRELEEYRSKHTFSSFEDACRYLLSFQPAAFARGPIAEDEVLSQQYEDEAFEPTPPAQSVLERLPSSEASMDVVQNGNKWMGEEVMVAFEKYIGKRDSLKGIEYKLDELHHQCLNVKNYNHIFHHFNFSVKTKAPGSTVWTSALYFAEVKTIFRQKVYFCWPLEPNENGHCYACKNQGVDDLKHPIIGAFDRGDIDTAFPFMYMSDDTACPYMEMSLMMIFQFNLKMKLSLMMIFQFNMKMKLTMRLHYSMISFEEIRFYRTNG